MAIASVNLLEKNTLVSGILTLTEAAKELRCSKAHLSNIIGGKIPRLPRLPVMRVGRRVLIRFDALTQWLKTLEDGTR